MRSSNKFRLNLTHETRIQAANRDLLQFSSQGIYFNPNPIINGLGFSR